MVSEKMSNKFSPNLVCTLILWRSSLRLLMCKFHKKKIEGVICPPYNSGRYYRLEISCEWSARFL